MEIIVSPDEAIACKLIDKKKSIWACDIVDRMDSSVKKRDIGNINNWDIGTGVISEVEDELYENYKISGIGTGMRCIIDDVNGDRKMIINCKSY